MKLEQANPGGSKKDSIALSMIEDEEKKGRLTTGIFVGVSTGAAWYGHISIHAHRTPRSFPDLLVGFSSSGYSGQTCFGYRPRISFRTSG